MTLSKILKTISAKEWWFVFWVSITLMIVTTIPLFFGLIIAPAGYIFTGVHFSVPNDLFVYYSYIEQAVQGNILFDNLYTNEPHLATLNILWLGVGLMAKYLNLSAFVAFNGARIFLIPIFYIVLYVLLSYLFTDVRKRQVATLIASFSSGMGFLLIYRIVRYPTNFEGGAFQFPMDIWVPESNTFLTLYYSPHFIASLILIISIFLLSSLYVRNKKISYSIGAGILAFLLFSFHPFHVPTIFGVLLVYFAAIIFRDSKIHLYLIKHYLVVFLLSAPAIFYYLYLIKFDFVMGQKALQNMTTTTPLWITFFSYGLLGVLAIAGIIFLIKEKKFSNKSIFIITWAVVQALLLYLPVNYQRRLSHGLHIPLVVLSTISLLIFYNVITKQKTAITKFLFNQRYLIVLFLVFLLLTSNLFQMSADIFIYSSQRELSYLDQELIDAIRWLKNTKDTSVIYNSANNFINIIPAYSGRSVYVGHGVETPLFAQKQFEVNWFFGKNRTEQSEINYLNNRSIDYIFYGPSEKEIGEYDPNIKSYLSEVYKNTTVTIYEVL